MIDIDAPEPGTRRRFNHRISAPVIALIALMSLWFFTGCKTSPATPPPNESGVKGDIELSVTGLEGSDGHLLAYLYFSEEHFPRDWDNAYRKTKKKISGSTMKITFKDLPHHDYAIVLIHDADDDGGMDFGLMGPSEGRGVSGSARIGIPPPAFSDAAFKLSSGQVSVTIQMEY